MADTENQIVRGNHSRKYTHTMLNMAESELDPFQYRLLGHYVRWADHGGADQKGIRYTAECCKMSVDKVRSTRKELVELKYIEMKEPTKDEQDRGIAVIVTVVDRWAENIQRYSEGVRNIAQGGNEIIVTEGVLDSAQGVRNIAPMNKGPDLNKDSESIDSKDSKDQELKDQKKKDQEIDPLLSTRAYYAAVCETYLDSGYDPKDTNMKKPFAFRLIQLMTGKVSKAGEGTEWDKKKIDFVDGGVTPAMIMGYGIWYKNKFKATKAPTGLETNYNRFMEFYSSGREELAVQRGEEALKKLLGIVDVVEKKGMTPEVAEQFRQFQMDLLGRELKTQPTGE